MGITRLDCYENGCIVPINARMDEFHCKINTLARTHTHTYTHTHTHTHTHGVKRFSELSSNASPHTCYVESVCIRVYMYFGNASTHYTLHITVWYITRRVRVATRCACLLLVRCTEWLPASTPTRLTWTWYQESSMCFHHYSTTLFCERRSLVVVSERDERRRTSERERRTRSVLAKNLAILSLKVNYVQLFILGIFCLLLWRWPLATPIQDQDPPRWGSLPGRVACVRTSHERTRQIDETFKYYINLAWHWIYKESMHLAGSRESWRLSPRVNHSQRTTRESASGISSASANVTNDDERVNESGERGQFVHLREQWSRDTGASTQLERLVIYQTVRCSVLMWHLIQLGKVHVYTHFRRSRYAVRHLTIVRWIILHLVVTHSTTASTTPTPHVCIACVSIVSPPHTHTHTCVYTSVGQSRWCQPAADWTNWRLPVLLPCWGQAANTLSTYKE